MKAHFQKNGKWINLFVKKGDGYYLPQGNSTFSEDQLRTNQSLEPPGSKFTLYDYQQYAIDSFIQRSKTYKTTCIVSGTGTGKSIMIFEAVRLKSIKTCIVVPKKALATQLAEDLEDFNTQVVVGSSKPLTGDIIIMTGMTFNKRYDEINGSYPFMILDECHRCPKTRREQIIMREGTCILGLTATLKRKEFAGDGFNMIYGKPIDTKVQALPVVVYAVKLKHNLSLEDYEYASAGLSPDSPEINRNLIVNIDKRNQYIYQLCLESIKKGLKRIIIFTDRVKHVEKIYNQMLGIDNVFKYYGGSDQEFVRNKCKTLDQFVIIGNIQCCGEGFNVPSLQLGILAVSTQRSVTVDQAVGRVRRKHGNKKNGYLIDLQDSISIGGSASKQLGGYQRKKIYKEKNRKVLPLPIPYE